MIKSLAHPLCVRDSGGDVKSSEGLMQKVDLAVLALVCIIFAALIPFLFGFGFNVSTSGIYAKILTSRRIASINIAAVALGPVIAASCYVIVRALIAVRHREGPPHYIEIGVRMLFCAPLGAFISLCLLSNTTSGRRELMP